MENVILYSVIALIKVSQCYVPSMVKDAIIRILEKITTRMLSNLSSVVYADCKLKHKLSSTPFIFSISNKLFMRTLLWHSSELRQPRVFVKALLATCQCINYKGLFYLLNSLAKTSAYLRVFTFPQFLVCQLIWERF